jgi:hypothetical protein
MSQLMDLMTQAMSGDTTRQIGRQLGTDEQTTRNAIGAALPMLVTALANNSSNADGARSLHDAVSRDHDGSVLDNLGGLLSNVQNGPGAAILRHVLGNRQPATEQAVSKVSGLDSKRTAQLLMLLAPVVLGVLGRMRRQQSLDSSGLAGALGGARQQLGQTSPDLMGLATRLLDKDGDGSITDELGGLAGKLFGGR